MATEGGLILVSGLDFWRTCGYGGGTLVFFGLGTQTEAFSPPTSTVLPGGPRFTWLNALKFSHRNSIVLFSTIMNSFESDRLKMNRAGPRKEPLEASPLR